ncbi:MAG: hypothetical protein CFH06_00879 [Alphaproteobacteria bacterium MarineAlpha3_Bin5]|nr:hypothetical protein [Magnetovibrio sp.]PPR78276.1 MAG: hypothetical protein CFH06_00879 [Alphaproteobacteria bacterium MarineAlpha3_Bin5]
MKQKLPDLFNDLKFADKLVVWSVRVWVRDFVSGGNSHAVLSECFKLARIPMAYPILDSIMTIYASLDCGIKNIRCVRCQQLSSEETRFLSLISIFQENRKMDNIGPYLRLWMPNTVCRVIQQPCEEFAIILKRAGLILSGRPYFRPLEKNEESYARKNDIYHK